MQRVLVVGASVAGVHAAEALREQGFDGQITLVSAEDTLPYDRPPLSKAALAGAMSSLELLLRPSDWYAAHDVELLLGQPARHLDVANRSIRLSDGTTLDYDGLVLATGSAARRPSGIGGDTNRIQLLRTERDCANLRQGLLPGTRLVIIGAGFIGLEVAATARSLGVEVTVVEIGPAPLAAVLGAEVGEWFGRLHERHGVSIRCRQSVLEVRAIGGANQVRLDDGEIIEADVVVAGVGATPMSGWLIDSGLDLYQGGVVCDAQLRAAAPGVVAAGDIAYWHNELFDERMRVEHWTNAVEQGRHAALSLLGADAGPYVGPPYFWTDQFTASTRTVGRVNGLDHVSIKHMDEESLVALYGRGAAFRGAVCVNAPRALLDCRRALTDRREMSDVLAGNNS